MKLKILAVDDEKLVLSRLLRNLAEAAPGAEVRGFYQAREALEEIEQQSFFPDAAFLDVEMPGLSGLELAKSIRELSPRTKVIFITGYSQYALEAYNLHARGYVMKPATVERLREELQELRELPPQVNARIRVQCFGNFDVFVDGVSLSFARSKAKELFAYLVHRRGAACTVKELAAALFEDREYNIQTQNYIQKIISVMLKTLADVGLEGITVRQYNSLAVNADKLDCDLYRFFKLDAAAVNTYTGEYMSQYSWAEFTIGYLDNFMR